MAERREYALVLCVRSPFMFEGSVNARLGVDSAFVRDAEGRPIIPQTQIRGVLRAALAQEREGGRALLPPNLLDRLFGRASLREDEEDAPNIPVRGVALFSDFVGQPPAGPFQTTRIAIDSETGAVTTGMLHVVELAQPLGLDCDFEGTLVVAWKDFEEAEAGERAIRRALMLVPAIGAYKSAGFGEVVTERCTLEERRERRRALVPAAGAAENPGRRLYRVRFDRPIVVDSDRVDNNLFEGSGNVPGAVFKGAIARAFQLANLDPTGESAIGAALATASFSHAFPSRDDALLGMPIPFSLVASGNGQMADLASLAIGQTLLIDERPAGFAVDSKAQVQTTVRERLSLSDLDLTRTLRTHVKINADRVAAEDQNLFALSMVETGGRQWTVRLDTKDVDDPAAAALIHEMLVKGLDGIGRTGASATFELVPHQEDGPSVGSIETVMLTTPAILFDPIAEAEAGRPLFERLAHYFEQHVGGARLANFFVRTELAGGYLATRYRAYGSAYYPFVLVRAGSVFRLECPTPEASEAVADALLRGLKVPPLDDRPATWRNCPFVRENGYGALVRSPATKIPLPANARIIGGSDVR